MANNQYKVKNNLPEVFLKTINSIRVKAPASRAIRSKIRENLLKNGILIDIYKWKFRVRSYYIFYDSAYNQGTYLMKKWSKTPIEVDIPGLHIPVAAIFHTSLQYWKDRSVFFHTPDQIESNEMDNLSDSAKSFRIQKSTEGKNLVFGLSSSMAFEKSDILAVNDYLSAFRKLEYLKILNPGDSDYTDSVNSKKPLYVITMKALHTNHVIFRIYPCYRIESGQGKPDPVYFIGTLSDEPQPFLARYIDFDPIIRDLSYFLKE